MSKHGLLCGLMQRIVNDVGKLLNGTVAFGHGNSEFVVLAEILFYRRHSERPGSADRERCGNQLVSVR